MRQSPLSSGDLDMATWTYDSALKRLLAHEGGYSNNPADPGGPTNFGITIADYRRYVKPNAGAGDVKAMKVDDAKKIYRAKYWDAQKCDDLPAGVDYAVFDYGVNSGIGRSAKVLQRIVGVTADGSIGPNTLDAVATLKPANLINAICDERLAFLKRLKTWSVFGRGWGRRVSEVRSIALAMANTPAAIPDASSLMEQAKAPPEKPPGASKAAGAIIAAGGTIAASHAAGWPVWAIVGAAVAIAVCAYLAIHHLTTKG